MNPIDLHPEDLLDRARRGEDLDARDDQRLRAHLAICGACALEQALAEDFARTRKAPLAAGSMIALDAMIDDVLAEPLPQRPPKPPRRIGRIVGAATVAAAAIALAAAFALRTSQPPVTPAIAPQESARPAAPPSPVAGPSAIALPELEEIDELVEVPTPLDPREPKRAEPAPGRPPVAAPSEKTVSEKTASDLFAEGNAARRDGDHRKAAALYEELERRFPETREAATARIGHGRLLLDRLGDANGALARFDRYLARDPGGALAEEARVGRALALSKLGRPREERRAWEDLLARHPGSMHAERARKRLAELPTD
jgi:hypothetical protein